MRIRRKRMCLLLAPWRRLGTLGCPDRPHSCHGKGSVSAKQCCRSGSTQSERWGCMQKISTLGSWLTFFLTVEEQLLVNMKVVICFFQTIFVMLKNIFSKLISDYC